MGQSIQAGMDFVGAEYSGKFDFVDTAMYWPITHMVAPKQDALKCSECHAKEGRLEGLSGVYIPGRDNFKWLDLLGYIGLALAFAGVLIHGLLRVMFNSSRSKTKEG